MNVHIPRKAFTENLIMTLYTHPSIRDICIEDDMVVPVERYRDFLHDFGIILGDIFKSVATVENEEEE